MPKHFWNPCLQRVFQKKTQTRQIDLKTSAPNKRLLSRYFPKHFTAQPVISTQLQVWFFFSAQESGGQDETGFLSTEVCFRHKLYDGCIFFSYGKRCSILCRNRRLPHQHRLTKCWEMSVCITPPGVNTISGRSMGFHFPTYKMGS